MRRFDLRDRAPRGIAPIAAPVPEHSNRVGAERLAMRIAAFWAERGHPGVSCTVEKIQFSQDIAEAQNAPFYGVRSNLRDGMPP